MATRRRRRRRRTVARSAPVRRRRRRRNPPKTYAANRPRRRRRRSYRRNPGAAVAARRYSANPRRRRRRYNRNPSFSVRSLISQVKTAAITAVQIVGGKAATRIIRNYIPGGKPVPGQPLTPVQIAMEVAAAAAVGFVGSRFLGAKVGANLMAGGLTGVIESLVKTYKVPLVADALGDDGDPNVINVPARMAGYVRDAVNSPDIAGYVQDGASVNGPGLGEPFGSSGMYDDRGIFEEIGV